MSQRTLEQIGQDYGKLMKKAAELQYSVYRFQKDLELTNEELENLNLEVAALPKAEVQDAKVQ